MSLAAREVVALDVPAGPEVVWDHLRHPELIRRWFRWDHPLLAEEIRRTFLLDATEEIHDRVGIVLRRLRWHNRDSLEIHGHEGGTHTRVTVRRPPLALLASFDGTRDELDEEWITSIHQLQYALDVYLGHERKSLAMERMDAGPYSNSALYRAGLHDAFGVPVGAAIQVHRPDGSVTGGTVAYRTAFQMGIRLHGHRETFFVLQRVPPASDPPHGTVSAFWSTYDLDDEHWAEAQRHWAGWWAAPDLPLV
jgi:hypothetical protein